MLSTALSDLDKDSGDIGICHEGINYSSLTSNGKIGGRLHWDISLGLFSDHFETAGDHVRQEPLQSAHIKTPLRNDREGPRQRHQKSDLGAQKLSKHRTRSRNCQIRTHSNRFVSPTSKTPSQRTHSCLRSLVRWEAGVAYSAC